MDQSSDGVLRHLGLAAAALRHAGSVRCGRACGESDRVGLRTLHGDRGDSWANACSPGHPAQSAGAGDHRRLRGTARPQLGHPHRGYPHRAGRGRRHRLSAHPAAVGDSRRDRAQATPVGATVAGCGARRGCTARDRCRVRSGSVGGAATAVLLGDLRAGQAEVPDRGAWSALPRSFRCWPRSDSGCWPGSG